MHRRLIPPAILLLACIPPVLAEQYDYLVFPRGAVRSTDVWRVSSPDQAPVPGKNVPVGSRVKLWVPEVGDADPHNYIDSGAGGIRRSVPVPDQLSTEDQAMQKVRQAIDQKLKDLANDKTVTDDQYLLLRTKLQRAQEMNAAADKQAKLDEVNTAKP